MENHLIQTADRLSLFMQTTRPGMAEIDMNGVINSLNAKAKHLLQSLFFCNTNDNNLVEILEISAPQSVEKIKAFIAPSQTDQDSSMATFSFPVEIENQAGAVNLLFHKISPDSIIVHFEEATVKYNDDQTLRQVLLDKAILQSKYEIASNILHDIGNAVVGFSSYVTRIKRSLEQDNSDNLQQLVGFFATQQSVLSETLGEAKAGAIIKILSGIAQTQKTTQSDISKSINEQQLIINHIQDILNIQREYVTGNKIQENRSTHLSSIIKDSLSMVFASMNKRNIVTSLNIPEELPPVKGDRTQLMQVVLNLLKNSIEAIDFYAVDKTISITVSHNGNNLLLTIQDSGKGFDEATGQKLFTRGFTTKSSGTGLGLEHCRAILEKYGNTIDITSEGPGKGAITTIQFNIL